MANPFYEKDVITVKDFGRSDFEYLFETVDKIGKLEDDKRRKLLEGKILGLLFFEPSTRTRISFEAAMAALGGSHIGFHEPHSSSVEKGENLADTIRTMECYADLLVLRHPSDGAAKFASEVALKPVINAGSGTEEHPTQAMLDLYTILKEKGTIDDLNIAIVGDLKYGRTVYSLLYALAQYSPQLHLVSPPQLKVRKEALYTVNSKGKTSEHENLAEIIETLDVLYVTRIQKERFPDLQEYEKVRGSYLINNELLKKAKDDLIVLHPLPRLDEISSEIDDMKQAKYFKQTYYGKIVREALLGLILKKDF
ncbi:MAG: aspartate carbamoyltransferase [Thaumarchaeota archaeon]|nr:aspartate carbamoyltransferase [Nitrososphaerota archaeon]